MGKLETTIILHDKFSKQLNNINKSIQNTANNMSRLNSSNAKSVKSVNSALSQQIAQNNTILKQMGQWATRLRNISTLYFGIRGGVEAINRVIKLSDRMTMNNARLGLMADSKNSVGALEGKSFAAAMRARTDYLDFSKAVTKLGILAGDKFANQDSIIRFTELMQKQFAVGGADASERSAAMLQLTQAIASNRLQGDELRSIRENAPLLVKAIQDSLGVSEAKFKDMAKAGEITADVIIKAMANSANEVEKMFNKLPLTWEHVWTRMKNVGYVAFKPIQQQLTRLFNNQQFLKTMVTIQNAMIVLGNVIGWVLEKTLDLLGWLIQKFNEYKAILLPIVYIMGSLVAATVAYYVVMGLIKLATIIYSGLKFAIEAVSIAQWLLNAAMMANPVGFVIACIFILIGCLYAVVAVINHLCGTSISATGIIAGAFTFLAALIWDVIVIALSAILDYLDFWVNLFIKAAEVVYNAWNNGWTGWINGVKSVFGEFVSWVLGKIKPLVQLWDKFKGTNYAATLTAAQDKFSNLGAGSSYKKFDTVDMGGWLRDKSLVNPVSAYNKAYSWGSNLASKISNIDLDISKAQLDALNGINNGVGDMSDQLGNVAGNTGDTAKNTGDTAKNTSSKYEQDYSYLRNWAYQSGLGNSIGYNIKIEQNNKNNIGSNMDLNRVVDAVRDAIIEGITVQAEGVRG